MKTNTLINYSFSLSEKTLRFESATMVGQRCLLHYLVPWLKNIELVDVSLDSIVEAIEGDLEECQIPENSRQLKPVALQGEGWGIHAFLTDGVK